MSTLKKRRSGHHHDQPALTVYVTPTCVNCPKTLRVLRDHNISHTVVDLSKDKTAYTYVTQDLGYKAAPIIEVKHGWDSTTWSGHHPDLIDEHIITHYRSSDDEDRMTFQNPAIDTQVTSGYGPRTRPELHGETGPHLHFRATEEDQA